MRKVLCSDCGNIAYQSRTAISAGLLGCPCGSVLEPTCLHDACAVPGEVGEAAFSVLCARETDSAVRRDNAQRRAIRPMRCPGTAERKCGTFVAFGTNHDPTHVVPCQKCGSTEPATFGAPRATVADPIPF